MSDKEKLDAIIAEKQDSLPFDEELDKAALKFYLNYIQTNNFSIDSTGTVLPREMAKFGAEWQKKKDEKFRADNNICCMKFDDIEDARLGAYEDGKSAMKRQMMEEAIPAFIDTNQYGNKYIQGWSGLNQYDEFDDGDEVKIIIVKE